MTFEIIPPSSSAGERLERAEVDLCLTVVPYANQRYPTRELWRDSDVIISWEGAGYTTITEDIFFEAGHAVSTFGPDRRPSVTDSHVATLGRERRIEVLLPGFADLCRAVVGTRRLATMHRAYAAHLAQHNPIRIHETWTPFPEVVEVAQWHEVRESDTGVHWLLEMLTDQIAVQDAS